MKTCHTPQKHMQQNAQMNVCVISPMAELGGENILGKG
jgi:hypothetical protein